MSLLTATRDRVGREIARSRARLRHLRQRVFDREALVQAGHTPFEVIHDDGLVSLRYYPPLAEDEIELADGRRVEVAATTQRTPLVIVPPLAVNMLIYDLFPERSLVRYLRARGFELYLVDWGRPSRAQDDLQLADYFDRFLPAALDRVRAHSGVARLNLHGWSFGGLFSLCHAAIAPEGIANLVLVGAPVDYHDNGVLGERYKALARAGHWTHDKTGLTAHNIPPTLLRSPGVLNSLVFKATSPMAAVRSYAGLAANLHDEAYVSNHATNAAFLDDMVAYPGGVVADFIDYLWIDNVLGEGHLPMADPPADLADVQAPILNISGRGDPIVTPSCSQAMTRFVASDDVTCRTIRGGHVGIVSSETALTETWEEIADWLIARD